MSTKRPCRLRERINIELLRGLDLGDDEDSLLLLAENYNQTTNDPTTETQSAQRTHRDVLKGIPGSLLLDNPCGPRAGLARLPAVVRGRCLSGLRRSSGRTGLPGGDQGVGRRPGRAKTTGSREGAIGAKFR
jgi:hypothetical protein